MDKKRTTPIDRPKLRESSGFKVRYREDIDQQERESSMPKDEMPVLPPMVEEPEPMDEPEVMEASMPEPEEQEEMDETHHSSIAEAIMAKNKKKFAMGGMVDADLKENFDSDFEDLTQPEDSNLMGDPDTSDESQMSRVSKIMRRMSAKSPMSK